MKVTITTPDGATLHVTVAENDKFGTVDGPCPHCGASPFPVCGNGITSKDNDSYYADAFALCCAAPVGRMRTQVETLFGLEEDEAVALRCRVYR